MGNGLGGHGPRSWPGTRREEHGTGRTGSTPPLVCVGVQPIKSIMWIVRFDRVAAATATRAPTYVLRTSTFECGLGGAGARGGGQRGVVVAATTIQDRRRSPGLHKLKPTGQAGGQYSATRDSSRKQ